LLRLSIFDICATLAHKNDEYIQLGQEIIEKMAAAHSSNEFIDFEISIHLVLAILTQRNILADTPLFYQRLCAWGWAGHISRILSNYNFDRLSTLDFSKKLYKNIYMLPAFIDRQVAPFWQPHFMSPHFLCGFL